MSTATHQTCLMMPATPAAVVGQVLRPVIAAGSIYRCARILNIVCSLSIWWHFWSLLLKVPPKLRSELSLAITSTATYQTYLILSTTLTAVMGAALTPVIAGCSIYRCVGIYYKKMPPLHLVAPVVKMTNNATKTTKRAITRDYVDRNTPDMLDVFYDTIGRDWCSINACHRCWLDV